MTRLIKLREKKYAAQHQNGSSTEKVVISAVDKVIDRIVGKSEERFEMDLTEQQKIDRFCAKCGGGFTFSGCSTTCEYYGKAFRMEQSKQVPTVPAPTPTQSKRPVFLRTNFRHVESRPFVNVRLLAEFKKELVESATRDNVTLSDYIRSHFYELLRDGKVVEDHEWLGVLSDAVDIKIANVGSAKVPTVPENNEVRVKVVLDGRMKGLLENL